MEARELIDAVKELVSKSKVTELIGLSKDMVYIVKLPEDARQEEFEAAIDIFKDVTEATGITFIVVPHDYEIVGRPKPEASKVQCDGGCEDAGCKHRLPHGHVATCYDEAYCGAVGKIVTCVEVG